MRWLILSGCVTLGFGCAVSSELDRTELFDGSVPLEVPTDAHSCSSIVIATRENYEAARECVRIDGDLVFHFDSDVARFEFPRLVEITGKIGLQYADLPHPLAGLRLPALKRVGGAVELVATRIETVAWPDLRIIGGSLMVDLSPELVRVAMPKLESVGGMLEFGSDLVLRELDLRNLRRISGDALIVFNGELTTARFDRIEEVGGMVYLDDLPKLDRSEIEPLWHAGDESRPIGTVGCCQSMAGL